MERLKIRPRGGRVLIEVLFDVETYSTVENLTGGKPISGSDLVAPEIVEKERRTPTDRCIIHRFDETKIDDLKEGDVAIFNERTGTKIKYKELDYLLQNDQDIYAVIED